jgi:hypothetical protein
MRRMLGWLLSIVVSLSFLLGRWAPGSQANAYSAFKTPFMRLTLMAGQACACAAVGPRKLRSNQAATAGWNSKGGLMDGNRAAQLCR